MVKKIIARWLFFCGIRKATKATKRDLAIKSLCLDNNNTVRVAQREARGMAYPSRFVEWFGPCMWKTMHSIAHSYPDRPSEETRRKYIDFFRHLGAVIPCPSCGDHYDQYLTNHPIDAHNRESLAKWVYELHSDVNQRKGKSNPTFEQVREAYEGWDSDQHARLNSLSDSKKQREMATPLLGFKNGAGESMQGVAVDNMGKYLAIGIGAFLLVMVIQRMRSPRQPEKEEK